MRLLIASIFIGACAFAADIPGDFATAGIVPDVLNTAPHDLLAVTFKDNDKDRDLKFGEELTPTLVKDQPVVAWNSEDNGLYTIAMVDPDAPSREDPKMREMLHWLIANIPGPDITKGETVAEYIGSGPQKDTGLHRYVLLVYQQPSMLTVEEAHVTNHDRTGRPGFSIRNFATKYKLGDPVAGNMFLAKYDDYVPILHKQLGE